MNAFVKSKRVARIAGWSLAAALAVTSAAALAETMDVKLTGAQEVPPVQGSSSGSGTVTINNDGSVSASISASGFTPTAAHIHEGKAGTNGKVIVPFTKEGDKFVAPAGAKLTPDQMKAFKDGDLYVNIHSAAHPGGEVRAQLKP
ncbi:MAG TPA: CHRD domain-containing protein [Casimicrobiaceae bacterium]|nr:CHRD domain-containing protein [Casimicrobiaceae bacterium]HXU66628.1 CHRD domain-containing protein [Casimicrobiaceae bacterium]